MSTRLDCTAMLGTLLVDAEVIRDVICMAMTWHAEYVRSPRTVSDICIGVEGSQSKYHIIAISILGEGSPHHSP